MQYAAATGSLLKILAVQGGRLLWSLEKVSMAGAGGEQGQVRSEQRPGCSRGPALTHCLLWQLLWESFGGVLRQRVEGAFSSVSTGWGTPKVSAGSSLDSERDCLLRGCSPQLSAPLNEQEIKQLQMCDFCKCLCFLTFKEPFNKGLHTLAELISVSNTSTNFLKPGNMLVL